MGYLVLVKVCIIHYGGILLSKIEGWNLNFTQKCAILLGTFQVVLIISSTRSLIVGSHDPIVDIALIAVNGSCLIINIRFAITKGDD